ncbi:MAG TPA: hypothetical protein DCY20_11415 [Firmicutes bacterium]|nr:hypothetical protein [Bacillota bacterium]
MFNPFFWSLYGIARENECIIGMWSSYHLETQTKRVLLLVSDIQPFLNLYWLTKTQPIKYHHLRCLCEDQDEVLHYSIITNQAKHYQIILSQNEDILLTKQPNLNLHLHKQKLNARTNLSRIYYDDCIEKPILEAELELLAENFYFECFNVAKSLRKHDYWKAKVIETNDIKACFQDLQKITKSTNEQQELTLEIKDCLEDFKMNTTWERLYYYIHVFEKSISKDKHKNAYSTVILELKTFVNKIYEESKQT